MAISIERDVLLALRSVPRLVRKKCGRQPHISTVRRWKDRGIAGVRLETVSIGNVCFTTEKAVFEFFERSSVAKRQGKKEHTASDEARRTSNLRRLGNVACDLGI
jgi:hypothetical protein